MTEKLKNGPDGWATIIANTGITIGALVFLYQIFESRLGSHESTGVHPQAVHQETFQALFLEAEKRAALRQDAIDRRLERIDRKIERIEEKIEKATK